MSVRTRGKNLASVFFSFIFYFFTFKALELVFEEVVGSVCVVLQ